MKEYFLLQAKRVDRIFREIGINPWIGLLLSMLFFALLSEWMFYKTGLAKYLLLLTALSALFGLGDKQRTEFILTVFGDAMYRSIRVAENIVFALPFLIVLIIKCLFLEAAILFASAILLAFFTQRYSFNFTLPTPFSHKPFEYSVGFRKTFLFFPFAYALTVIAILVGNMNLGIFSMIIVHLLVLTYSSSPEHEYYIWIHARSPKSFLKYKIVNAMKNASLLAAPILLVLCCFYPTQILIFLALFLIANLYVLTIVMMKYSAYPFDMNIPEGIVLICSIFFPPILLLFLPFYISKANKKLSPYLNDPH
jgi:hypothetical protein